MKRTGLLLVIVLWLAAAACTLSVDLPASQPGEVQTVTINEAAPASGEAARVEIEMGGGTLNIRGGGSGLVSGTIAYNLAEWEPEVTRDGDTVRIEQEVRTIPIPDPDREITNEWDLQFGGAPLELEISAGAYDGTLDFSNVPLTGLKIADGATNSTVRFDTPNPAQMERFEYSTGASSIEVLGLSNANFSEMSFSGSAGSYTLDFGGELQRDASVEISGAVGDLTLIIPPGRSAQVTLTGELQDVDAVGAWQVSGDTYTLSGSGPALEITVEMSLGSLKLVSD